MEIQSYSLIDFARQLKDAYEKGYSVSDDVDKMPQIVGSVFVATLVKDEAEVEAVAPKTTKKK